MKINVYIPKVKAIDILTEFKYINDNKSHIMNNPGAYEKYISNLEFISSEYSKDMLSLSIDIDLYLAMCAILKRII